MEIFELTRFDAVPKSSHPMMWLILLGVEASLDSMYLPNGSTFFIAFHSEYKSLASMQDLPRNRQFEMSACDRTLDHGEGTVV